eukprot:m51a1_g11299 hypothetical protein (299) ;mRNA; f:64338-65327
MPSRRAVVVAACALAALVFLFSGPSAPAPEPRAPTAAEVAQCKSRISRVVHQSWKTRDSLPEWSLRLAATWRRMHPRWAYALHSDDDNRALFARVFPELLGAYDRAIAIVKADLARMAYLYDVGGGDLDTEALAPLDGLLERACELGRPVILGRMDDVEHDHPDAVPNALMASAVPGEELWRLCAQMFARNIEGGCRKAEKCAGPVALRKCLEQWAYLHRPSDRRLRTESPAPRVWLMPKGVLYPHSWFTQQDVAECIESIDPEACKRRLDLSRAYTMVYWKHSWVDGTEKNLKQQHH